LKAGRAKSGKAEKQVLRFAQDDKFFLMHGDLMHDDLMRDERDL